MKQIFKYLALPLIALFALPGAAHAQIRPEIYVVMFEASWCGPCKIVKPNLSRALNTLRDPSIEYVTIDITNPATSERAAHSAFDHGIVTQYNGWFGTTGFAAIIDADTKRTLGCVNMMYDAGAMAMHIKNLKTYAIANKTTQDITCPAPNKPLR